MQALEQRRLDLVARSHLQRQELIAYGAVARDAMSRLQLVLQVARGAAHIRRLWSRFSHT